MSAAVPDPAAAVPTGPRRQTVQRILAVAAICIQVVLLYEFFVMGLGWGGVGYVANLAQGVVVLVVAGLLIRQRPLLVLPLPLLSFLLMLGLQAVDPSLRVTDCRPAELTAAAELAPPPGSPPLTFQTYPHSGCGADFHSSLSGPEILDHYRRAAENAGWQVEELDPGEVVVAPGEEPPSPAELEVRTLSMSNPAVTAEVSWEPAGDEGPLREQTSVVVYIYERNR